jgi:hypothetical protein
MFLPAQPAGTVGPAHPRRHDEGINSQAVSSHITTTRFDLAMSGLTDGCLGSLIAWALSDATR